MQGYNKRYVYLVNSNDKATYEQVIPRNIALVEFTQNNVFPVLNPIFTESVPNFLIKIGSALANEKNIEMYSDLNKEQPNTISKTFELLNT